jgi:hypothetical protein
MAAGFAAPFLLSQLSPVAWTWNVAIGSTATFVTAVVLKRAAKSLWLYTPARPKKN